VFRRFQGRKRKSEGCEISNFIENRKKVIQKNKEMKTDIILSGVGGQGILSIAAVISLAALKEGLFIKQSEVHGMSQRGGDVQSNLRLSDKPVASDLIPTGQADLIISLEPMESMRYLPFLKKDGWLVTNSRPYVNIPNYPEMANIEKELDKIPNKLIMDVDGIAKEIGTARIANMVILGAATPFLNISYGKIADAIKSIFASKGEEIQNLNISALKAGYDLATKNKR
jgi:indolepyruvate ferredoxin oxidoreductase beta subunit